MRGIASGKELVPSKKKQELMHRHEVLSLEDLMQSLPEEEKRHIPDMTHHFFAPGCYARMYLIPTGDIVIGKIHKTEHFNILCRGKVSVASIDGPIIFDATERPQVFVSTAGVKKAVYAIEEAWWITIHVTEETDLEKIEDAVIAKDFEQLEHQE